MYVYQSLDPPPCSRHQVNRIAIVVKLSLRESVGSRVLYPTIQFLSHFSTSGMASGGRVQSRFGVHELLDDEICSFIRLFLLRVLRMEEWMNEENRIVQRHRKQKRWYTAWKC